MNGKSSESPMHSLSQKSTKNTTHPTLVMEKKVQMNRAYACETRNDVFHVLDSSGLREGLLKKDVAFFDFAESASLS